MAKGKFDYSQFKELYYSTKNIQRDFDKWLRDFLLTEALRALRLVRPATPFKTGTLRRMWSITKVERTGNSLIVYLVNPMEYASFMEHGFTYHTKDGDVWYEGFHMAEISLLRVKQLMPGRYDAAFKTWLKKLGWG